MRLKIKKDIKNMMQSMLRAHDHVMILLRNRQFAGIKELLGQCQECAEYIGKTIEESEGMDTRAVLYLEIYCEQIYKMCLTTDKKKLTNLKKQADNSIYNVKQELDTKISLDRPKIVFMPYKASMWDCMESVWEAAEADPDCEVYVVPIPYYERNEKGEVEQSCYEGERFPKYVPITLYKNFSLEKEKPDIIYIHNPYDSGNYVTSVAPEYYSSNLKKYTDNLVYIPYFFSGSGPLPEAHRALPAYVHVDKIVVQDDEKAKSLSEHVPEEKIVVIGSPKVDRLLKLNKEKEIILKNEIQQVWKEKIKGKKVILFNISISGILHNSDYAMKKIQYVLSIFRSKTDVILLWRPHPLIEATLKSMRLEMYNEYMRIKRAYIKEDWGIFDDSEDAGIAAIVADAYLGEKTSSLVHYFGVLGKPVFYIDWKELNDKKASRAYLSFNQYFVEEDSLFFVPTNRALGHDLYKLDLVKEKAEKVITFPGTPGDSEQYYSGIKKVGNKIVLIPDKAEDIYVYDMRKKQAVKIVLLEAKDKSLLFNSAVEYNGKLFFIPKCYPAIVSLDMDTLEVCEFSDCIEPFIVQDSNRILFIWSFLVKEQHLYLASCSDNRILKFNMDNGSFEIKRIGECSYGFGHMMYDGEFFWLTAYTKNCVVRWDENSGNTKEYCYLLNEEQSAEGIWSLVLDKKDEIVICPGFSLNIVFINKETGRYRVFDVGNRVKDKMDVDSVGAWEGFMSADYIDEQTIVFNIWKNRSVLLWNPQTNQWKRYLCRLPENEMLKAEKRLIERNWIVKAAPYNLSEKVVSIPQFIDYIAGGDIHVFMHRHDCYQIDEEGRSIGEKIHDYFKS